MDIVREMANTFVTLLIVAAAILAAMCLAIALVARRADQGDPAGSEYFDGPDTDGWIWADTEAARQTADRPEADTEADTEAARQAARLEAQEQSG